MQPNLASPPPPPPKKGPSPLLFLGLVLGTTGLFAYVLDRKSRVTTASSKRLRAADVVKPGNWMGDQDQDRVEDPEIERNRKMQEAKERRLGAVGGGTNALGGGWESVRSPGVQPPSTMPPEFRGEVQKGREPVREEKSRLV